MPEKQLEDQAIFEVARNIDSTTARESYIHQMCGEDLGLEQRVKALLKAFEESDSFLESPPSELEVAATQLESVPERVGTKIGSYKLLQQIGEGGMGVVYMAEQTDPVERRVALKIIKPGMDTKTVIARFEAERQALAMMDHPGIAKVLDVGTTKSGRPYFVMELVRGVPITQYCDEHQLTPRQRLELFLPVCQAVQHAHQKGIIHRDIKPSNVLVAEYDDRPVPKIIDFGLAKAMEKRLTAKTIFTEFGQVVGTPDYMSPEQAKLNQMDIDTRSDIYSLGVLLYELLSGITPFDRQRLRSAAFDELLRIIREEDPPKPSQRLSTVDTLPSIAASRHITPAELTRQLSGELDWIVMRTLEKDRARRYDTAIGLANDIRRFLDDEPVLACPPSHTYLLRKFTKRNKASITAFGAIAISLLAGIVGTTWMAVDATQQRDRAVAAETEAQHAQKREASLRLDAETVRNEAQAEARRAKVVLDVIIKMFSMGNSYDRMGKPTDYTVRELLLEFGDSLPQELENEPGVNAEIHAILAKGYVNMAGGRAERHLREALRLREEVYGEYHPKVAESLISFASYHWSWSSDWVQAETMGRRAISILKEHPEEVDLNLRAYRNLVAALRFLEKHDEVEQVSEEAMLFAQQSHVDENMWLAALLNTLAASKKDRGLLSEAEIVAEQSVRMNIALDPQHKETAWSLYLLGNIERFLHKYAEAEEHLRQASRLFGNSSQQTQLLSVIKRMMNKQGKTAQFQAILDETPPAAVASYHLEDTLHKLRRDDIQGYKDACKQFLVSSSKTANPGVINYATWACMFHPEALDDWALATELALRLQSAPDEHKWDATWYKVTLGTIQYRAGNFEDSVRTLSLAELLESAPDDSDLTGKLVKTQLWFYLALRTFTQVSESRPARGIQKRQCP